MESSKEEGSNVIYYLFHAKITAKSATDYVIWEACTGMKYGNYPLDDRWLHFITRSLINWDRKYVEVH